MARLFFTPAERRPRAGFRLLGQLILMGIILGFIICLLAVLILLRPNISNQIVFFLGQAAAFPAVTLSVYLARRWLDRRSFASLGLHWDAYAARDLLVGFGIAGISMGLIFALQWSAGWLDVQGYSWQHEGLAVTIGGPLAMLLAFIIVGWQEELLHRGYWLQNLAEGLNLFWGVLISSCAFSLTHLANPNLSIAAILGLFLAGIFLAYGYLRTRQLWLPIGLHIGWNFFEGTVFGFPVSGLEDMPGLLYSRVDGPELLTGGAFGPEAGLVLLPALALGAGLVYLYTRRRKPDIRASSESKPTITAALD